MKKELRKREGARRLEPERRHKTTVCVYSLRARERPTVSTPLDWDEVEELVDSGDPELLVFDSTQVLERIERAGRPLRARASLEQSLPEL